jgi:hypothetical protein
VVDVFCSEAVYIGEKAQATACQVIPVGCRELFDETEQFPTNRQGVKRFTSSLPVCCLFSILLSS